MDDKRDRIVAIDMLRGFAVLGILLMNITSFSLPTAAYYNPFAYVAYAAPGESMVNQVINQIIYGLSHVVADQKFMAIFSLLFGASLVLFLQRLSLSNLSNDSDKKISKKAVLLFYSRNFWLLIIGLLHFYFIWYGDILAIYAVCAFILFFFRNLLIRLQIALGLIIFFIPIILNCFTYAYLLDDLSEEQQTAIIRYWSPDDESLTKEINAYQGSYLKQIGFRSSMLGGKINPGSITEEIVSSHFLIDFFLRSLGMMLVGMGAFRLGIFSGTVSQSFYKQLVKYGIGAGFPLALLGVFLLYYFDWDWKYGLFLSKIPNTLATPLLAFGYLGIIMLWEKTKYFSFLQNKLILVGKTALSSYLLQSVLATFIFYGFGWGWFAKLSRLENLAIVFFIWLVLLIFSSWWLKRFLYGPLEWAWRCLTYLKIFPLKRSRKRIKKEKK